MDVTATPFRHVWIDYVCAGRLVSSSSALDFLTKMSKKCKSISHFANQVKSRQKIISIEDKLDIIG
jgi:hypothetical protein